MPTIQSPFEKLSEREMYRNKWLNVVEHDVVRPDGSRGIFGIVTMRDGSTVVAIDSERRVYLASEYKYALGRQSDELVSGGIDSGEAPLDCAKRELREELGLVAKQWTELGVIDPFTSVIRSRNYMFLAEDLAQVEAHPDDGEVIIKKLVPLETAVQMVMKGEISHGASCVALLLTARHLGG